MAVERYQQRTRFTHNPCIHDNLVPFHTCIQILNREIVNARMQPISNMMNATLSV